MVEEPSTFNASKADKFCTFGPPRDAPQPNAYASTERRKPVGSALLFLSDVNVGDLLVRPEAPASSRLMYATLKAAEMSYSRLSPQAAFTRGASKMAA